MSSTGCPAILRKGRAWYVSTLPEPEPESLRELLALPPALPAGGLTGVRTRIGAEVDLTWAPVGRGRS